MWHKTVFLLTLAIVVGSVAGSAVRADASATDRLFINPPVAAVQVGDTFTVRLTIDSGIADVHYYRVKFQFDTVIVRLDSISPSPKWDSIALANSGQSFNYKDSLDPDLQEWYIDLFSAFYTQAPNIDGYADLAEIHFTAVQTGVTPVDFLYHRLEDNVGLGNLIPSTSDGGYIYVCPLPSGFEPGNCDGQGTGGTSINVSDLTYLVAYLFQGGPEPVPVVLNGDCDCSLQINVSDLTYLVAFLFTGGPPPCNPCD